MVGLTEYVGAGLNESVNALRLTEADFQFRADSKFLPFKYNLAHRVSAVIMVRNS